MQYIYMHNYRGFHKALLPLHPCTFLVGENSTGKSSFLRALQLVFNPSFWFMPEFNRDEDGETGTFSDLVSATAEDKSSFELGLVDVRRQKDGSYKLNVLVHQFRDREGIPFLAAHFKIEPNYQLLIKTEGKIQRYSLEPAAASFVSESDAVNFASLQISKFGTETELTALPESIAKNFPLPVLVAALKNIQSGKKANLIDFAISLPVSRKLTWIAPIRMRPKRIYPGSPRSYSAEGEHSPYLLRASLKSKAFVEKINEFGRVSGLFETIETQTYGEGARNPFEILIKLPGADLTIDNVGYGVSQVLPLLIEFLAQSKGSFFAVQQPEVHLHPRAQAALGGLLAHLAKELKHSFIIETHSDYMIDRFRLELSKVRNPPIAQVLFFQRTGRGNHVTLLPIAPSGRYPKDQPKAFRDFFINEEMQLLSL